MRILAVAASARRQGNSDALLECALEGVRQEAPGAEVERLAPYGLPITPCRSCNGCWNTGHCVVNDAMQGLYSSFLEADHVVVASPIYFTSLPGHFKVLIDRFQCFWARTYRLGQPPQPRRTGMFLCVGAINRQLYYQSTLTIVKTWLSTINVGCPVARFFPGLDAGKDILRHAQYLEEARVAGAELVRMARASGVLS